MHAKTREECLKKLRRLLTEIESSSVRVDRHTRVSELAARWLEDAGGRLKPKTVQGYRSHVVASIVPILGTRPLAELRPSDVRRMHNAIFARGVGAASVPGAHRTLSAMLHYAADEGYITRNVAEAVDIPTQSPFNAPNLEAVSLEGRWALVRPKAYRPVWHRPDGRPLTNTDTNDMLRAALLRAKINRDATTHWPPTHLRHDGRARRHPVGGLLPHLRTRQRRRLSRLHPPTRSKSRAGVDRLNAFLRSRGGSSPALGSQPAREHPRPAQSGRSDASARAHIGAHIGVAPGGDASRGDRSRKQRRPAEFRGSS